MEEKKKDTITLNVRIEIDEEQRKELFGEETVGEMPVFTCNPFMNKECSKTGCKWLGNGPCYKTLKEECKAKEGDEEQLGVLWMTHNEDSELFPPYFITGWMIKQGLLESRIIGEA